MPTRATKRGDERTPLDRDCDVLICGASFAGLAVARELAGTGADVMVVDRYEIGERQTSACGIPTTWLTALDWRTRSSRPSPSSSSTRRTPPFATTCRGPSRPLTTGPCAGCWRSQGSFTFETAKVERREGPDAVVTDRARSEPGSSSTRWAGGGCWARGPTCSPPTRSCPAGWRSTRSAAAATSRCGSTAATSPPATAGASLPARRCGSASARSTPGFTCATPRCDSRRTSAPTPSAIRATGSPTPCARPPTPACSSSATPPATACR